MSATPGFSETLELLQRARAGERAALARVVERYQGRMTERVRLMMGQEARRLAESSDFLQETFAQALHHFERFEVRDERGFLGWLTTIARNCIRQSVRRERERAFASLSQSLSGDDVPGPQEGSPPSAAAWNEASLRLVEALEELPEDQRSVIELRELEGLTFGVAGERLGRSESAVRRLHAKALIRLGDRVGRQG